MNNYLLIRSFLGNKVYFVYHQNSSRKIINRILSLLKNFKLYDLGLVVLRSLLLCMSILYSLSLSSDSES